MRLLAIFLLTALCCDAATYRFDFTPGYAYVLKVKAGRPQSIHVARIIKEKLKRIPQKASLDREGHFTIICTLESQNEDGPTLSGFASLSGEVSLGADGVPEIDERDGKETLKPVSSGKRPNQAPPGSRARTAEGEAARAIVEKHIGDSAPKTGGPLTKEDDEDLKVLATKDREKANALLSQGAVGFVVYVPEIMHTAKDHQNILKIGRIVFVKEDRVVGDFLAR